MENPATLPKREGGPLKVQNLRYVIAEWSLNSSVIIYLFILSIAFFHANEVFKAA